MEAIAEALDRADDFTHEEEVARNPYSIRNWWNYIEAKRESPSRVRAWPHRAAWGAEGHGAAQWPQLGPAGMSPVPHPTL